MVKNPNWQKADQLAIYQHGRKSELFEASEEQFHWAIGQATLVKLKSGYICPSDRSLSSW